MNTLQEWLARPEYVLFRDAFLKKGIANAVSELRAAARNSNDPAVRAASRSLEQYEFLIAELEKQRNEPRRRSSGEDDD